MNKKVLIIGPKFHYFNQSVGRAFETLGWSVVIEAYDTPLHPYSIKNRIRYKLTKNRSLLRQESQRAFKIHIEEVFERENPDLIFILNGDILTPLTVSRFQLKVPVVIWLFDSLQRYPDCVVNLSQADLVYCYEQEDIPSIREQTGIEAIFLSQAVDPSLYHSIPHVRKEYDILFAGDIYQSDKRKRLLQAVVKHFPDKKIRIWGRYKPWYKNFWQWLCRERRDIYMNRNIDVKKLNEEYNKAHVVLNIHAEQQRNGANPKLYEIAAAGARQVCDSNSYIDVITQGSDVLLYCDESEMLQQLERTLGATRIEGERFADRVKENHTYEARIREVCRQVMALPRMKQSSDERKQ